MAFLEPGDPVMGLSLPMGGHLTHGWSVSATGKWFRPVRYDVRADTGRVDMDQVRDLALKERPKVIWCGGTAIPRTIDFPAFAEIAREAARSSPPTSRTSPTDRKRRPPVPGRARGRDHHDDAQDPARPARRHDPVHGRAREGGRQGGLPGLQGGPHDHTTAAIAVALKEAAQPDFSRYARQIVANAQVLAAALTDRGYDLISGGTDNHLILIDLTGKGVAGKPAAQALDRAGIELNYNAVPFDRRKPFDPSGMRLGTAAITTRGLAEDQMPQIAAWIDEVVQATAKQDETVVGRTGRRAGPRAARGLPDAGLGARALGAPQDRDHAPGFGIGEGHGVLAGPEVAVQRDRVQAAGETDRGVQLGGGPEAVGDDVADDLRAVLVRDRHRDVVVGDLGDRVEPVARFAHRTSARTPSRWTVQPVLTLGSSPRRSRGCDISTM